MKFELFKLFPETIGTYLIPYDKKNDFFTKKLTFKETNESKEKEIATGSFISNDLYVLNKNKLLKNKLLKFVNHFIKEELGFNFNVKITTSWGTKTLPQGFSTEHAHSLSFYSGVYYPCITENLYNIKFVKKEHDFFIPSYYVKHFNHINNECIFSVKYGTLLLFNSRLSHKIPKNKTNEIRYSLAFNIMPIGNVGNKNSDSYYYFK